MKSVFEWKMRWGICRLKHGSELGRFDQFWDDNELFECRYSHLKWFYLGLSVSFSRTPLEIYLRALKGNKNITYINFANSDSQAYVNFVKATICDLHGVTSIYGFNPESLIPEPLLAIHRDPLFITSTNNH